MSDQDTYEPGPKKSRIDKLDPQTERVLREAELVYDDIFGKEPKYHFPSPPTHREFSQGRRRAAAA